MAGLLGTQCLPSVPVTPTVQPGGILLETWRTPHGEGQGPGDGDTDHPGCPAYSSDPNATMAITLRPVLSAHPLALPGTSVQTYGRANIHPGPGMRLSQVSWQFWASLFPLKNGPETLVWTTQTEAATVRSEL